MWSHMSAHRFTYELSEYYSDITQSLVGSKTAGLLSTQPKSASQSGAQTDTFTLRVQSTSTKALALHEIIMTEP